MAGAIRTVCGDLAPERLGWCQCHEHLFLEDGPSYACNPALRMDDLEASAAELQRYAAAGGCSYVDAQPVWCGRMAERMQAAAARSGVQIIACTGYHRLQFYTPDAPVFTAPEQTLYDVFCAEIRQGMLSSVRDGLRRTDARAGAMKIAIEPGWDEPGSARQRLLDAALAAARDTGVPVMAHFEPEMDVLAVLERLQRHGLTPERFIACHLDRTHPDSALHRRVAQAGAYLDFDSIARYKYHDDETQLRLIEAVWQAGLGNRLLLSLDTTAQRLYSYGGSIGLDYILTTFSQQLALRGLGRSQLEQMMITNAANALALAAPREEEVV